MAHVLVVDDTPEDRALLRAIVESRGHEVSEAPNGVQALERLRRGGVDLVISDGLMPEMGGFRLCLEIRRDPKLAGVPFIFHTATFTNERDQRLASELGAQAYLVKPAPIDLVVKTVEAALGRPEHAPAPALDEAALLGLLEQYGERLDSKLDHKVEQLEAARDARDSFRALLDNLPLIVVSFDAGGRIDHYNRMAIEFSGGGRGGSADGFLDVDSPEESDRLIAAVRTALADGNCGEVTATVRHHDGRPRTLRFSLLPYHDQDGVNLGVVAAGVDVTEENEYSHLLLHLAEHDVLTDLPNRRALDARFEEVLQQVASGKTCALLFIDADRFKTVNDEYGHDVGDAALANLARLLTATVGPGDLVVRLCGDEFVVLAENMGWDDASALAERIRTELASADLVPGAPERRITVSIGVNVVPEAATPEEALRESDRAMYRAKSSGRDRTALSRDNEGENGGPVTPDSGSLRHPVTTLEFYPVYSPLTGELSRCAARATFEVSGMSLADEEYMAAAARNGVASHTNRRTIELLLDAMSGSDIHCSARLWLSDVLDPTTFDWVEDAASRRGVDPRRLAFELTVERILRSAPSLTWLKAASRSRVRLILDARGVELMRIVGLPLAPFSELAFPLEAVRGGDEDLWPAREAVLFDAARDRLKLTATGIESREALAYAIELGVDYVEGGVLGVPASSLDGIRLRIEAG
ncbi:MAG: hypothetical protein C0418_03570 [Coriobacteriaceae bacterium]|nr:hypothetical protein [Coriobacteriaceae bacterium]